MSKQEEKLRRIVADLREAGFEKDVPESALDNAIMRQVGVSLATLQVYKRALEAWGLIRATTRPGIWVIR